MVKLLLEHGAHVHGVSNLNNVSKVSPLHLAVNHGDNDIAKLLLDHGADPELQDSDGDTPLDVARNNASMLLLLQKAKKKSSIKK